MLSAPQMIRPAMMFNGGNGDDSAVRPPAPPPPGSAWRPSPFFAPQPQPPAPVDDMFEQMRHMHDRVNQMIQQEFVDAVQQQQHPMIDANRGGAPNPRIFMQVQQWPGPDGRAQHWGEHTVIVYTRLVPYCRMDKRSGAAANETTATTRLH
jgi:hypothetical protein